MKMKHLAILTLVVAMMVTIVGAVSAQGRGGRGGRGGFDGNRPTAGFNSTIITDATGLTQDELREAIQNGSTIAELIEANGGDVDTVIADLVAEATANLNERTDNTLETLEERITDQVNGTLEYPQNGKFGDRSGFGLGSDSTIILDATGLTQDELRDAVRSGSTIAELITANGGDVDAVIAELVVEATTAINERVEAGDITQDRADAYLETLEDHITERLNGTFERPENGRGGRGGFRFDNDNTPDDTTTDDTADDAESA